MGDSRETHVEGGGGGQGIPGGGGGGAAFATTAKPRAAFFAGRRAASAPGREARLANAEARAATVRRTGARHAMGALMAEAPMTLMVDAARRGAGKGERRRAIRAPYPRTIGPFQNANRPDDNLGQPRSRRAVSIDQKEPLLDRRTRGRTNPRVRPSTESSTANASPLGPRDGSARFDRDASTGEKAFDESAGAFSSRATTTRRPAPARPHTPSRALAPRVFDGPGSCVRVSRNRA